MTEDEKLEIIEDSLCNCGHPLRLHDFGGDDCSLSGRCHICGGTFKPKGCREFEPKKDDLHLWGTVDGQGRVTMDFTSGKATIGYDGDKFVNSKQLLKWAYGGFHTCRPTLQVVSVVAIPIQLRDGTEVTPLIEQFKDNGCDLVVMKALLNGSPIKDPTANCARLELVDTRDGWKGYSDVGVTMADTETDIEDEVTRLKADAMKCGFK